MGFFSSDRSIQNYADEIWGITPFVIPEPSVVKEKHFVSTSNLVMADKKN